jgi:uncharacterized membrane-anchored protein
MISIIISGFHLITLLNHFIETHSLSNRIEELIMTSTVLELIKVVIIIKVRRINRIKDIIEND